MSQQQEVPFNVIGASGMSFFDQKLEISAKEAQVEKEIQVLKESLIQLFGDSFMCRVEADSVWAEVDSEEFDVQFLHHEVPTVANIATLTKRVHVLKEECQELTQRLEQLRESQRPSKYDSVELFSLIENLGKEMMNTLKVTMEERIRTEVDRVVEALRQEIQSFRPEVDSVAKSSIIKDPEAVETKGPEAAAEVEAAEFLFDSLSSLESTATAGEAGTITLETPFTSFACRNYAIYSIASLCTRAIPPSGRWRSLVLVGAR